MYKLKQVVIKFVDSRPPLDRSAKLILHIATTILMTSPVITHPQCAENSLKLSTFNLK